MKYKMTLNAIKRSKKELKMIFSNNGFVDFKEYMKTCDLPTAYKWMKKIYQFARIADNHWNKGQKAVYIMRNRFYHKKY